MTLLLIGIALVAWPSVPRGARADAVGGRRFPVVPAAGLSAISAAWWVGGLTASVSIAAVGGTTCFLWWRGSVARRESRRRRELTAAVDLIVGELRTGANPSAACAAAGEESSGEVRRVLVAAASRSRLGGSCGSSLLAEPGWPDVQRLGGAWQLAEQYGIPVANVLDAARRDVSGRLSFDATVHSSLAGARATAAVLSCLPLFGIALGEAMGAQPVSVLFSGGIGGTLLVLGCGFGCAGMLWTHAITAGVRT